MKIIIDYPPNIEDIRKVFPLTGREIFTWGNTIYNSSDEHISNQLAAHEYVHCIQQGNDKEGWWKRYLIDTKFRFNQELEAHKAEYKEFCRPRPSRLRKRVCLKLMARRLSSPMYGRVVTFEKAKKLIK